jgi:LmbE family N-acetylglucosaminyl deacetylase
VIFTHFREDWHQDHRTIAELTWNTWRNHLILEYEIPKYDGDLGRPNLFVPVSRTVADAKISCLLECFPTQKSRAWFTAETFLALMRLRGIECASPTGLAEAFHARKLLTVRL